MGTCVAFLSSCVRTHRLLRNARIAFSGTQEYRNAEFFKGVQVKGMHRPKFYSCVRRVAKGYYICQEWKLIRKFNSNAGIPTAEENYLSWYARQQNITELIVVSNLRHPHQHTEP